jgi:hypothetical protein
MKTIIIPNTLKHIIKSDDDLLKLLADGFTIKQIDEPLMQYLIKDEELLINDIV